MQVCRSLTQKKVSNVLSLLFPQVKIQFATSVSLLELNNFLSDEQNGKVPQDAVQALDIIMREVLSLHYPPVGRSFFPFDGQGIPLGEGCELLFGFYSNVRHSHEWKAMLVNIDGKEDDDFNSFMYIAGCTVLSCQARDQADFSQQFYLMKNLALDQAKSCRAFLL